MVDATRIPDQLRENVWQGRIDAHRLHQYYGRLARVHTRNVSIVTTLGCFVAFVGPYLDTLGAPGWEIVVSLVGVVVAITTIAQGHNRIVEALFRHAGARSRTGAVARPCMRRWCWREAASGVPATT